MFSSIPQIGNYLVFRPTIQSIAPTILAAIFLCALGSFYPAWRAAALTPAEAIRKL
jgi:ABC-type lipoprotein release transport system permease subunit